MRAMFAVLAMLMPVSATAQATYDATYVVQQNGREIGRERVVLRAGQGGDNSRLELESRYAGASETARAVLTRGAGSSFESLQLELRQQASTETIRVSSQGNRIFITTTAQGARGGRELPGGPGVIMLDDRLLGLLTIVPDVATADGVRLTAVSPRTGKRTTFSARRQGQRVELAGEVAGRIDLDADGRVERITLDNGIILSRLPR